MRYLTSILPVGDPAYFHGAPDTSGPLVRNSSVHADWLRRAAFRAARAFGAQPADADDAAQEAAIYTLAAERPFPTLADAAHYAARAGRSFAYSAARRSMRSIALAEEPEAPERWDGAEAAPAEVLAAALQGAPLEVRAFAQAIAPDALAGTAGRKARRAAVLAAARLCGCDPRSVNRALVRYGQRP